jgi:hypothetical protein
MTPKSWLALLVATALTAPAAAQQAAKERLIQGSKEPLCFPEQKLVKGKCVESGKTAYKEAQVGVEPKPPIRLKNPSAPHVPECNEGEMVRKGICVPVKSLPAK